MIQQYFFWKGRQALLAILEALEIRQDDEIILPGFTCIAVPNVINFMKARPVYVDIKPGTYNIDPAQIESKITAHTRAIIMQHTFGFPAAADEINGIARKHKLFVIEDACHCLNSVYRGKDIGTLGDAAFFSSQWSKPMTTGLGGWLETSNETVKTKLPEIYSRYKSPGGYESRILRFQVWLYRNFFSTKSYWLARDILHMLALGNLFVGSSTVSELKSHFDGEKKKMAEWQKELLLRRWETKETLISHKIKLTRIYDRILGFNLADWGIHENSRPVLVRYPVWVQNKREVLSEAKRRRVEIGDWFISPVHPIRKRWEAAGYYPGTCPEAEKTCAHLVNLPLHWFVTEEIAEKTANFVKPFLRKDP